MRTDRKSNVQRTHRKKPVFIAFYPSYPVLSYMPNIYEIWTIHMLGNTPTSHTNKVDKRGNARMSTFNTQS